MDSVGFPFSEKVKRKLSIKEKGLPIHHHAQFSCKCEEQSRDSLLHIALR